MLSSLRVLPVERVDVRRSEARPTQAQQCTAQDGPDDDGEERLGAQRPGEERTSNNERNRTAIKAPAMPRTFSPAEGAIASADRSLTEAREMTKMRRRSMGW